MSTHAQHAYWRIQETETEWAAGMPPSYRSSAKTTNIYWLHNNTATALDTQIQSAVKSYLLFYVFILKIASRHCCYLGCDYSEQKALSVHNVRLSIRLSVWLTNRLLSDRVKCQGSLGFPAFPPFPPCRSLHHLVHCVCGGQTVKGKARDIEKWGKIHDFYRQFSGCVCVCVCVGVCLKVP